MTDGGCTIACLQQSAQAAQIATPAISNALMGLVGSLGGGALIGFFAGFTLRKLAKVAMFIIGFFALGLMFLHYKGIFRVDWKETEESVRQGLEVGVNEVSRVVANTAKDFNDGSGMFGNDMVLTGGVTGFVGGFLYGVKKG